MHNLKLIFIGSSTLDKVWHVQKLPFGGFKSKATKYFEIGGGMAANAAVAASRLGANSHLWGRAGNDVIGNTMKKQLEQYEVNCRYFRLIEGAQSAVSSVIVDENGERMIINYPGSELSHTPAWLPFDMLVDAAAVQGDTRWLEGTVAVFEKARALNIPTVIDAEKSPLECFEQILPLTDYAFFSETGLTSIAALLNIDKVNNEGNEQILNFIQARYKCKVVAVTKGHNGVDWIDASNNNLQHQDAFKVDIVDTTGAGDIFHGAFTFAIAKLYKNNISAAIRFAQATAAIKCTRLGGRCSPDFDEVISYLDLA
jgi:sulfofructose kinase